MAVWEEEGDKVLFRVFCERSDSVTLHVIIFPRGRKNISRHQRETSGPPSYPYGGKSTWRINTVNSLSWYLPTPIQNVLLHIRNLSSGNVRLSVRLSSSWRFYELQVINVIINRVSDNISCVSYHSIWTEVSQTLDHPLLFCVYVHWYFVLSHFLHRVREHMWLVEYRVGFHLLPSLLSHTRRYSLNRPR